MPLASGNELLIGAVDLGIGLGMLFVKAVEVFFAGTFGFDLNSVFIRLAGVSSLKQTNN